MTAQWHCLRCHSSNWNWSDGSYCCAMCGGKEYYDALKHTKMQTEHGTWMFVPRGSATPSPSSSPQGSRRSAGESVRRTGTPTATGHPPDDPGLSGAGSEFAESEVPTHDPCVTPTPDGSAHSGRRRRRRRLPGDGQHRNQPPPHVPQQPTPGHGPHHDGHDRQELLGVLRQLLCEKSEKDKDKTRSDTSWNSMRGPMPGVRWRGGAAPQPPKWSYQASDLRAFSRYEKRVRTWVLQSKNYMTAAEQGLALYVSLQGEAEAESEHLLLEKINDKEGVNYILNELRGPLQQKELFQKRKLLADFEHAKRVANESVRQYINRYKRIERDLQSIGIETSAMYDSESRGNRLLDRCALSPELQRLVLIGAGNRLDFTAICDSLVLQFPDFKPAPPIWFANYGGKGNGQRPPSSSSSTTLPSTSSASSYRSSTSSVASHKGLSKGKGSFPRRVFQTDVQAGEPPADDDDAEYLDPAEEDDGTLGPIPEGDGDEEEPPEDDEPLGAEELSQLAQVLTVTSRKLQASMLGRKFSNRKSIEERKKSSSCSACGRVGHWVGDASCPLSADHSRRDGGKVGKGSGKQAASSSSSSTTTTGNYVNNFKGNKKAYVVGFDPPQDPPNNDDDEGNHTYFTFTSNHIIDPNLTITWVAESVDLAGYMVLDTACQRSCCGEVWLKTHTKILQRHRLRVRQHDTSDHFQFGSGAPIEAKQRAYFPIALPGQETMGVIVGASVLSTGIPFLASRTLLERLGCIIDMFTKTITFTNLGVSLPLVNKHGHLAVKIVDFPDGVSTLDAWKKLSHEHLWHDPDPELITAPGALNKGSIRDKPPQALLPDVPHLATGMASELGAYVSQVSHRDVPNLPHDVQDGQVQAGSTSMAELARTPGGSGPPDTADGDGQFADAIQPGDLRPSSLQEVRQCSRILQPMPKVPDEVQVGRGKKRMGRSWRSSVASFFALATALIFQHPAECERSCEGQGQVTRDYFESESEASGKDLGISPGRAVLPGSRSLSSGIRRGRTWIFRVGDSNEPRGLRHGLLADYWELDRSSVVRHHAAFLTEVEHNMMTKGSSRKTACSQVDILETFAGRARISARAPRFGLKALTPIDYNTGYDLNKQSDQEHVDFLLDRFKPLFLIQGIDCRDWSLLQDNTNYVRRKILLMMRRVKARKTLKRVVKWCLDQDEAKRFWILENPTTSRIWLEPILLKLLNRPNVYTVTAHSGAYGAVNSRGQMIRKGFKFAGNCPHVLQRLCRKLNAEQLKQCVPLEGKETTLSQHYPEDMIKEILIGIKETAKEVDPTRFMDFRTAWVSSHVVLAVSGTMDFEAWKPMFESARTTFTTTPHVPHTHRGWAILYTDGTCDIMEEDLANVRHPRAKFSKPVDIGIFFFGYATDVNDPQLPAPQPTREDDPNEIVQHDGISFPKAHGTSLQVKTLLSRMHKNLGHPHAADLKKMLAMNGIKDQKIYDAVDDLRCEACLRVKGPPDEIAYQFATYWARAFGYPLKIKLDPDGGFRGGFEEAMDEAGVYLDYVPAESHHRIGLVERHNSILRDLMERIINDKGITGAAKMELTAVASCFAKNAHTWSSGRPPFIAAFGRIPRMGINLLSDPHGLAAGRTRDQAQRDADILRSEAQQHLASMSIDNNLRRALLRKATTVEPRELPVGSIAAYWRWTAKSGKKRGGFKLARVLGRDPDGKSMWLQAGTNTVKVSPHQVREALGFENWCPSYDDIKALRSAQENLQHGRLRDEQLPSPDAGQVFPGQEEVMPEVEVEPSSQEPFEPSFTPLSYTPTTPTPQQPTQQPTLPLQPTSSAQHPQQVEEQVQTDPYLPPVQFNMSSPTYRQTIIQNQTFGMTEDQRGRPHVHVPVRKAHRSRSRPAMREPSTPALPTRQDEPPLADASAEAITQGNETPPLPAGQDELIVLDEQEPAPEGPVSQLPELVTIEDDAVGDTIPTTPEAAKMTPAKRSLETAESRSSGDKKHHQANVSLFRHRQHDESQNSDELNTNFISYDDGIQHDDGSFDGSPDVFMPNPHRAFMNAYRNDAEYTGNGDSDISDAEVEDFRGERDAIPPTLTRQEQKALDKEIPWQKILQMDKKSIEAFVQSAKKEEAAWQQFQSVSPVPREEAQAILKDKIRRKRVLRSRAAFRDKARGLGELQAKTRIVALGCLDPDLFSLQREAATPLRQSEFLIMSIYVAGVNHMFMYNTNSTWCLWVGDVKTAFLQGEPDPRAEPLYLLPPQDGVCKLANIFPHELYLIRGNIYGLASAPRTWCMHVIKVLTEAGFVQNSLDKMLFCYYMAFDDNAEPVLAAIVVAYVDDFLLAHDSRYDRGHLLKLFKWGNTAELTTTNPVEFKGKRISLKIEEGEYQLHLDQEKFINGMKGGSVPKKRLSETIDAADVGELRSVAGCLQWLAGQTRPDIASTVSLHSKGAKATYNDLQQLYNAVQHVRNTASFGLVLRPVPINMSTMVVTYADSSWANADKHASQHGALILLADQKATDVITPGTLVDFKSSKSSRVCRSTLAAEASAADMSVDRSSFIAYLMTEILLNVPAFHLATSDLLRMIQVTDCRSLYDVLVAENPKTEEKRTIVSIRSAQQFLTRENVHWVPTRLQWADGLTKVDWKLAYTFFQWLQRPWIQLHETGLKCQQNNPSVKSRMH
eukprot:Skav215795  [mRNA]  locus=scaffold3885:36272:44804:+ [translate_table: standard]